MKGITIKRIRPINHTIKYPILKSHTPTTQYSTATNANFCQYASPRHFVAVNSASIEARMYEMLFGFIVAGCK